MLSEAQNIYNNIVQNKKIPASFNHNTDPMYIHVKEVLERKKAPTELHK